VVAENAEPETAGATVKGVAYPVLLVNLKACCNELPTSALPRVIVWALTATGTAAIALALNVKFNVL
jgi:hypothetical protein